MRAINSALNTILAGTAVTSLLGSGTASVFYGAGGVNAKYPMVVFSKHTGVLDNEPGHDKRTYLYFVRAYSSSSMAQASQIDEAISGVLHKKALTVSGYTNYYTSRETDLESATTLESGQTEWMAGALYRITIDA